MLEMIAAELFKAVRKKRTWTLVVIFGLLVPIGQLLIAIFTRTTLQNFPDAGPVLGQGLAQITGPYELARNGLGVLSSTLLLPLAAVFAAFLVGEERGFKMWKVILTSGRDRLRVAGAKFVAGMLLVGLVLAATFIGGAFFGVLGIVFGLAPQGFAGNWGDLLAVYGMQWLSMAAPLALGFLFSWIIATPALAVIGVVVLPGVVEGIIAAVIFAARTEPLSPLNAPFQVNDTRNLIEMLPRYSFLSNINIGSRFIGEAISNTLGSGASQFSWGDAWWAVAVSAVYFAFFMGLFLWSFLGRDIQE